MVITPTQSVVSINRLWTPPGNGGVVPPWLRNGSPVPYPLPGPELPVVPTPLPGPVVGE